MLGMFVHQPISTFRVHCQNHLLMEPLEVQIVSFLIFYPSPQYIFLTALLGVFNKNAFILIILLAIFYSYDCPTPSPFGTQFIHPCSRKPSLALKLRLVSPQGFPPNYSACASPAQPWHLFVSGEVFVFIFGLGTVEAGPVAIVHLWICHLLQEAKRVFSQAEWELVLGSQYALVFHHRSP